MPTHSKNYDTTPVDGLPQHVSIADLWSGQEVQFTYISPKGKSELVTKKVVDINRETEVVTFLWKTGEVFPVPVSVTNVISLSVLPHPLCRCVPTVCGPAQQGEVSYPTRGHTHP